MHLKVIQSSDERLEDGAIIGLVNNGSDLVEVHKPEEVKIVLKLLGTVVEFHLGDEGTMLQVSGFHEEQDETFTRIEFWAR